MAILLTLLAVKFAAWQITENMELPEWIDYKPYHCRLCLGFWLQMLIYSTFGALLYLPVYMYGGWIIATLDAIAYWIHIKRNTESIYDSKEEPETTFVPAPSLEDAKFTRLYLAPRNTEEWQEIDTNGTYSDLLVSEDSLCLYRQHIVKPHQKVFINPNQRYKTVVVNAAGEYILLGKSYGLRAVYYPETIGFNGEQQLELVANELCEAQQLTEDEIKQIKESISNGNK